MQRPLAPVIFAACCGALAAALPVMTGGTAVGGGTVVGGAADGSVADGSVAADAGRELKRRCRVASFKCIY